jgi:hypothetical protein
VAVQDCPGFLAHSAPPGNFGKKTPSDLVNPAAPTDSFTDTTISAELLPLPTIVHEKFERLLRKFAAAQLKCGSNLVVETRVLLLQLTQVTGRRREARGDV